MNDTLIVGLTIVGSIGTLALSPVLIVRLILSHRERLATQKNRQEGTPALAEEVAALKKELTALRDTTTRCDLTFDAAIDRIENRLAGLETERRAAAAAAATAATQNEPAYLRQR